MESRAMRPRGHGIFPRGADEGARGHSEAGPVSEGTRWTIVETLLRARDDLVERPILTQNLSSLITNWWIINRNKSKEKSRGLECEVSLGFAFEHLVPTWWSFWELQTLWGGGHWGRSWGFTLWPHFLFTLGFWIRCSHPPSCSHIIILIWDTMRFRTNPLKHGIWGWLSGYWCLLPGLTTWVL